MIFNVLKTVYLVFVQKKVTDIREEETKRIEKLSDVPRRTYSTKETW